MIPRPPSSTLFPTRRSSDLVQPQRTPSRPTRPRLAMQASLLQSFPGQGMPTSGLFSRNLKKRSEEHTSELQSHSDLVCRLLLEKKKKSQAPAAAIDPEIIDV